MALSAPFKIGFLIFKGFPMSCLTSMIEPLRAANEISDTPMFEWVLVSENPGKIRASANVVFEPDAVLSDNVSVDCLILLSSPSSQFENQRTPGHLRALSRHGVILGAVSAGIFPLARSGVIGTTKVSVHWCYIAAFRQEFSHIVTSDQVIELTPTLMTASGATAAFDLSLMLIRANLSPAIATEVACWFQHPVMRGRGVPQITPDVHTHSNDPDLPNMVGDAVALYTENLGSPPSIQDLATALDITPRHLERRFKKATGKNPSQYFRMLRMNAARQIVLYTNDPIATIAGSVGYGSTAVLTRHYVAAFGRRPEEDRIRTNNFRVAGNSPVPST